LPLSEFMNRILTILLTLFALPVQAQNAVDFLFAEDNQNLHTDQQYRDFILPKSLIKESEWLNAPLTRLDYVLMGIEERLNKEARGAALEYIPQYFERSSSPLARPSADFSARYIEALGRIVLVGDVRDVGKPKKPMKEFCQRMFALLSLLYPREFLGYHWQNTTLRVLMREGSNAPAYVDAASRLAESVVYSMNITSVYKVGDREALFTMDCRKQDDKGEVSYSTYSGFAR